MQSCAGAEPPPSLPLAAAQSVRVPGVASEAGYVREKCAAPGPGTEPPVGAGVTDVAASYAVSPVSFSPKPLIFEPIAFGTALTASAGFRRRVQVPPRVSAICWSVPNEPPVPTQLAEFPIANV